MHERAIHNALTQGRTV